MFKRVSLLVISVLLISHNALAANAGPYVGGYVGRDSSTLKGDQNNSANQTDIKYQTNLTGYNWGAHVGYDFFLSQHAVLGAQVFLDKSTALANASGGNINTLRQFKKTDDVGIEILPGYQINSTNRLSAVLGWVQSKFSQTTYNKVLFGPEFNVKKSGIQTGVLYQTNLSKQWTADFSYIYSDYRSIHTASSDGDYTFKPTGNDFNVGVNYYFEDFSTNASYIETPLITQGWYVGAAAGLMTARIKQDYIDYTNQRNNSNYPYGMRGELANGHMGYRWQFGEHYVVGVEGFAQGETTKMDYAQPTSQLNTDFKFRENWSWGLSVLPGIKITPSNLLYLRVGSIYSKFSNYGSTVLQPLFNETQTGLQTGLGWETAIAEHFSIFGEYDHAQYAKITTPDPANSVSNTYKLSDDQYKLGMNYSF